MLRRLHPTQPESFAFTQANQVWAEAQITKYPEGRQASAVIPLLWRAQEQEGWLSRPAMEAVADMLGMDYMRVLEVATFYFMFQLQPVGEVAHFQICGTTSCMICGSEDLIAVCREKIAAKPHEISADGKFSWEEVECLGACTNAPMAQIGKDYYEDLTPDALAAMIDEMAAGQTPRPGPANGRYAAEPLGGLTALKDHASGRAAGNASVALAAALGDGLKRIDGSEVPLRTPWIEAGIVAGRAASDAPPAAPERPAPAAKAAPGPAPAAPMSEVAPELLNSPRGEADDLKKIKGIGPQLERVLNEMGVWHFWQIAAWGGSEIAWVDARLKFKGRIARDNWIAQAEAFAGEG